MHKNSMYDEERMGVLEDLLKMIGGRMSGQEDEGEMVNTEGDEPFGGEESAEEEMMEKLSGKEPRLIGKNGLDREEMGSFFKGKNNRKPDGVSAKMIAMSIKPKSKKMKG